MRILFVHQGLQSFVAKDLDVLHSANYVRGIPFRGTRDVPAVLNGAPSADLAFCWFGKLHAFFAVLFCRLLGKKAVVVAGGDEVACDRHFGYGMFTHWWKRVVPAVRVQKHQPHPQRVECQQTRDHQQCAGEPLGGGANHPPRLRRS